MDVINRFAAIDVGTLFRLMFVADVMVCMLLFSYQHLSENTSNIRTFILARIMNGTGCLLISLFATAPFWLQGFTARGLLIFGFALEIAVVARLRGIRGPLLGVPITVALIGISLFTLAGYQNQIGIVSGTIAILFAFGIAVLLSTGNRSRLVWVVIVMYTAVCLSSLQRSYAGFFGHLTLDDATLRQLAGVLIAYMYCIGGGVGFLLMLKEEGDRKLRLDATTDSLTGLLNHRAFFDTVRAQLEAALISRAPLSMLSIDLDHFKLVNDTYGHQIGDEALRSVTAAMRMHLPDDYVFGRVGGEEFAVLLPFPADQAQAMAERLRQAAANARIEEVPEWKGTVSIGGSVARLENGEHLQQLVRRCDIALYEAKRGGRNRVMFQADNETMRRHP